jgi:hypothetical protein|tara:strand:- start:1735 stop:2052 length:318 start_codon:yes stop_codon:yes gene_type:complete
MPMYEPLPKNLRIQKSEIEGQGLFSLTFLKKDTDLGLTHIILNDEIIRTPLGGFINHSDDPNCTKVKKGDKYHLKTIGDRYYLKTLKDITSGEELTVKYSFYKVT